MDENEIKRTGDSVDTRRIRRTVIIFILTIIAIYTAAFITINKVNWYYGCVQDTFSPWIPEIAAAAAGLIYVISRRAKNKKEAETRQLEDLLDTPLKKFSDTNDQAEILTHNYDGDPGNDVDV